MNTLKTLPVISTDQAVRYFRDYKHPSKRVSDMFRQLEEEKLVEGRRRSMGETKVWRLSKKGREELGVNRKPLPLNATVLTHALAIGNVYLELKRTGGLLHFETELREEYTVGGKVKKYCPDAFFIYKKKPYLLEVQLTPLSSDRWAKKWETANEFFSGPHLKASWQKYSKNPFRPEMVVLTKQNTEIVKAGSRIPLIIVQEIIQL